MHLFEYKLQRCPYKGSIVYIFHIVFSVVVSIVHDTQ